MRQSPRLSGHGSSSSSTAPPQHSATQQGTTNQAAAASSSSAAAASASASSASAAATAAAQAQAHARARNTALGSLSARRKRLARQEVADKKQACKPHVQQPFQNEKDFFDRLHVFHVRPHALSESQLVRLLLHLPRSLYCCAVFHLFLSRQVFDSVMPDREKSVRYRSEMADHAAVLASKINDLGERYFEFIAKTEGSTAIQARHAAKAAATGDKRATPADDKSAADGGGSAESASKRAKTDDSTAAAIAASPAAPGGLPAHINPGTSVQQLLQARVRFDAEFRAHVSTLQRLDAEARQRQEAKHAKDQADMMERYRLMHASQAGAAGHGAHSSMHSGGGGFPGMSPQPAASGNYAHYGMQQQQQGGGAHGSAVQRQQSPLHSSHHSQQQHQTPQRFPPPQLQQQQSHAPHAMQSPMQSPPQQRLTLPPTTGSFDPLSASYNPYQ